MVIRRANPLWRQAYPVLTDAQTLGSVPSKRNG